MALTDNFTAALMPQIQPIGINPHRMQRVDYSRVGSGDWDIAGKAMQGYQMGQQIKANKQKMEQAEYAAAQQREKDRMDSLARGALELKGQPREQQLSLLQQRAQRLADSGIDNADTLEAIELHQQDPQTFDALLDGSLDYGYRTGLFKTDAELAAAKNKSTYGAQQTFKDEKDNLFFGTQKRDAQGNVQTVMTPVTAGTEPSGKLQLVSGLGQTANEKSIMAIEQARQIAELKEKVEKGSAAEKEFQKQLGTQRGEIDRQQKADYKLAQDTRQTLSELELALDAADTGKWAQAKTVLGKWMPGMDVSSEENLDALLTQLGIQQLMQFSGPTTDFEFVKSMNTLAQTGNTKEANRMIVERMKRDVGIRMDKYKAYQEFKKDNPELENFIDYYGQVQEEQEKNRPPGAQVRAGALYQEGDRNRDGTMAVKNGWWVPVDRLNETAPPTQTNTAPTQPGTTQGAPGGNVIDWGDL